MLFALIVSLAVGQVVPEREVEIIQSLYGTGKYAEAARRANESLALVNFSDVQRVKLHELAGLSSFNLGDLKSAQSAFLQLLKINPDHVLDPFAVPPLAIRVFDQVRKDNADALNLVRQQLAIRADQEKRAAEDRLRLQREEEERRRAEGKANSEVVVRTVERHSMLVNFIPFGVGQFTQGRTGWGVGFAVSEGIMAVLSIVSFFAIEALYENIDYRCTDCLTNNPDGVVHITMRGLPRARLADFDVWNKLKFGTGIAFYSLWALGIAEAIWHHQDEVVTEQRVPTQPPKPSASLRIFPTQGGLGAGVTIRF